MSIKLSGKCALHTSSLFLQIKVTHAKAELQFARFIIHIKIICSSFQIINFYMNLLMDRGEKDGKAKVYAFNTFFYPKILSGGQPAVKRWTRKVDIFAHDYILIPVHLGMHWCLAVSVTFCIINSLEKSTNSTGGKATCLFNPRSCIPFLASADI